MIEKSSPLRLAIEHASNSTLLQTFAEQEFISAGLVEPKSADLVLSASEHGIQLMWQSSEFGKLKYCIDVDAFAHQQKTFPAAKQAGLNQAVGKKSRTVIDATAGWGGDALLLCSQGMELTLIERNPIIALLLEDAMLRLARTDWALQHHVSIPRVINGDAISVLGEVSQVDCIYLDPMFPSKRKKSAAVNKYMRLLRSLVGPDQDAVQLLDAALASQCSRVVVKRPDYADPLKAKPTQQFSSKLLHYDVYIKHQSTL